MELYTCYSNTFVLISSLCIYLQYLIGSILNISVVKIHLQPKHYMYSRINDQKLNYK